MNQKCNEERKIIDLHMHSTKSDGNLRPDELVKVASQKGISVISITDHDSIEGIKIAVETGKTCGIEVIPGIELSVNGEMILHILGYFIDIYDKTLINVLEQIRRLKAFFWVKAIKFISDSGVAIDTKTIISSEIKTLKQLKKYLLEKEDICLNEEIQIAFKDITNLWKQQLLTSEKCISLIHECGGIAFLAHPSLVSGDDEYVRRVIIELKSKGLDGIEVIHPCHTIEEIAKYENMSHELNLLCSGGSDFHGTDMSQTYEVPYEYYENLKLFVNQKYYNVDQL